MTEFGRTRQPCFMLMTKVLDAVRDGDWESLKHATYANLPNFFKPLFLLPVLVGERVDPIRRDAMGALLLALCVFVILGPSIAAGMWIRGKLLAHHLSEDSKEVMQLATAVVGTLAALALGLLIASARSAAAITSRRLVSDAWASFSIRLCSFGDRPV